MKIYLASNCFVESLELFMLKNKGKRLHSYPYQVEKGKPVKDLLLNFQFMDGKKK